ncbi:MAG TPA: NAD(P)/FAD-dependent oxidoreductase [Gemmatimonadaceae bacterium]
MRNETVYDVAIVGGGPAGLSAAVWLGRYLRSVVLVDSGDPRNWEARGINGFLGLPRVTPQELRAIGREEARRYGARLVDGEVTTARREEEERFRLELRDGGTALARRVLLAIGIKDVWPDIPGLEPCYGDTVHHCPDCDGHEARGCRTVVVASGRKAVGMALDLTTWTREIIICTNGAAPDISAEHLAKLDALDIPVLTEPIARAVHRDGVLQALALRNGLQLDCERLFFAFGHYPADDLGVQLGCERDDEGLIVIDAHYHTSVYGVYAAGDIVPGPHLAIAAASDGAMAALSMHRGLVPGERKLEVGG